MSPVDGLLLLIALAAAAGWWSGLRAREAALQAAREATDREGLQLLDSAVAGGRSRIVRGAGGRLELHRRYRFEFSDDGLRRLDGEVRLRGRRVIGVTLAPWKADASEGPDPLAPAADPTRARVAPASWTVVRGGRHGRTPGPG
jgi:hypothetical protein